MSQETEFNELLDLRTLADKTKLQGRWSLNFKLVNSEGSRAFTIVALSSYTDPLTKKTRHLFDVDGQFKTHLAITKQKTIFKPDENENDKIVLDWLIGHPEIGINNNHVSISDKYIQKKNPNPRFILTNLDHVVVVEMEEEDYIDNLIGRIVRETGPNQVDLETLRFVLSYLNKPHSDAKHMRNREKEKQVLRKSLKDYVRSSYSNAKKVNKILNNLGQAKFLYEIKEMVDNEILNIHSGMYKTSEGMPIGTSTESVIKYFSNNIDVYSSLSKELYEALKHKRGY